MEIGGWRLKVKNQAGQESKAGEIGIKEVKAWF